eukprot:scaffold259707_cov41-Attheya_sp.AAC.1
MEFAAESGLKVVILLCIARPWFLTEGKVSRLDLFNGTRPTIFTFLGPNATKSTHDIMDRGL